MAPAHLFRSALTLSDLERFYREVQHTKVHADDRINCGEVSTDRGQVPGTPDVCGSLSYRGGGRTF